MKTKHYDGKPGHYQSECRYCHEMFIGDKRDFICHQCEDRADNIFTFPLFAGWNWLKWKWRQLRLWVAAENFKTTSYVRAEVAKAQEMGRKGYVRQNDGSYRRAPLDQQPLTHKERQYLKRLMAEHEEAKRQREAEGRGLTPFR